MRVAKLSGAERPLEVFYFVEGPRGERVPAETTAATLNRLDLQRAAIILGHRVQRPLAQRRLKHSISIFQSMMGIKAWANIFLFCLVVLHFFLAVETISVPPSETQSNSIWLIVGVVVPVLLAVFIIIILYWKLCGSEKLEFQPDAINSIQQRQKVRRFTVAV